VSCISRIILNDVKKQSEGLKGSTRIYANYVLIYRQIGKDIRTKFGYKMLAEIPHASLGIFKRVSYMNKIEDV